MTTLVRKKPNKSPNPRKVEARKRWKLTVMVQCDVPLPRSLARVCLQAKLDNPSRVGDGGALIKSARVTNADIP